jgi:hypothetical protein
MADIYDKIAFQVVNKPLFDLGGSYSTPGALSKLSPQEILEALLRHAKGDWGQIAPEDLEANNRAVKDGGRLFSQYEAANGRQFWIITEADRSITTVLLPEEY